VKKKYWWIYVGVPATTKAHKKQMRSKLNLTRSPNPSHYHSLLPPPRLAIRRRDLKSPPHDVAVMDQHLSLWTARGHHGPPVVAPIGGQHAAPEHTGSTWHPPRGQWIHHRHASPYRIRYRCEPLAIALADSKP
jgi:hypothetical protein